MISLKLNNSGAFFTLTGEWTVPANTAGIVLLANQTNNTFDSTDNLSVLAQVGSDWYVIIAKPGEVIIPYLEGVGPIVKFKDAGSKVRCVIL